MNPASVSQKALATWAQEMGFVNFKEAVTPATTIYAVAVSTPARRNLWEMTTRSLKDRRLVKKVRKYHSNDGEIDVVREKIKETMLKLGKVESDVSECQKRCTLKIKKIKEREESEERNGKLIILTHFRKRKNSQLIKSLELLREKLTEVTELPHNVTDASATEWLNEIISSLESKWCNFRMAEDIKARIENDRVESIALWDASRERSVLLREKILQKTEKANDLHQNLISNLPRTFISWTSYFEKQKINSSVVDDLLLLIKGIGLHKKIGPNPNTEKIVNCVEKCLRCIPVEPFAGDLLDDSAVEQLRLKADDSQLAYVSIQTEVNEMIRRSTEFFHQELSSRRELLGMKKNKQEFLVDKGLGMQAQVVRLRELCELQKVKLCDGSLKKLRDSADDPKIERRNFDNKNLYTLYPETTVSLCEIMEFIENSEDFNLTGSRGSKLQRSLILTRNRITLQSDDLEKSRGILKLWKEQPFGNMIPDSFTVSGLTYKEWKMQASMSVTPPIRQDQSCFDFNMTSQSYFK